MPPVPPFVFPTLPQTWYIGHMHRAMREITEMVQKRSLDLIIETRDARVPLTSINPAFERILAEQAGKGIGSNLNLTGLGTKRLIVYNKTDLAQDCFQEPLKRALAQQGEDNVLFTDARTDEGVRKLLRTAIKLAKRPLNGPDDKIVMLVAGMPNVGKSSILNALRRTGVGRGKAASTSSEPGHTRRLSTVIKIATNPPVYILDTPGIMVPYLGKGVYGQEAAMKLALTGGIKESLFEKELVGEYLLWRLRLRHEMRDEGWSNDELWRRLALPSGTPLEDPEEFYSALARRLSAMQRGGIPDTDFAGRWLIRAFREGKLGRWTLDGLGRGGEAVDDDKEMVTIGEGEAKKVVWQRTEERLSFLSRDPVPYEDPVEVVEEPVVAATSLEAALASAPPPEASSPEPADANSTESLASLDADAPTPEDSTPAVPAPPTVPTSVIEPPVSSAVAAYYRYLHRLSSSADLRSANQTRKDEKAGKKRQSEIKFKKYEIMRQQNQARAQGKPTAFKKPRRPPPPRAGGKRRSSRK
ncbi:mitochondrial GTPase [Rhodotorula toruloides]|uniref:Mitochondrial GTPase n=1 Tax=Rhodotorula toruloides TaxID=5286 RepID=A0A511KG07_RHOTO|nr:mitochondrial GTPase [Rhodotorula toruloides]